MSPKKALCFSICIRMVMVFFCISICFVRFIESDDETKQGLMEKDKRALVLAAEKADNKGCKNLLAKGVTLDGVLADGSTPLHLAALNSPGEESFTLLKEMLSYFGNPTVKDHEGRTPLHMACMNTKDIQKRNDAVALLLLNGGDINAFNNYGRTVIADIVTLQSKDNVETFMDCWGYLCTADAIEKAKNLAGSSAGIGLGYTDIYEVLAKKTNVLSSVAKSGLPEVVMRLLHGDWNEALELAEKEGALSLVLKEKYEKLSLLFIAVLRGEKKLAKALLAKGVKIDHQDNWGRNILHVLSGSCLLNEGEKIKLMNSALEKGAQSIGDKRGDTIVHIAVKNNYVSMVIFLKEKYKEKISFGHRNNNGDRPVDIASRYGKSKLIELLSSS